LVYFARALNCSYPILEGLFCNTNDYNLEGFVYKGNVWALEIMFGRISEVMRINILINSIKCGYGGQLKFILGMMSKNDLKLIEGIYIRSCWSGPSRQIFQEKFTALKSSAMDF
jgi:hypothetical protein